MPRFVILEHSPGLAGPRVRHWDFMLEAGDSLRTWALAAEPAIGATVEATALPDHRPAYLEYEGPVSGDRGTVARFDRGEYQVESESPASLCVTIAGSRLRGKARLQQESADAQRWRCEFTAD